MGTKLDLAVSHCDSNAVESAADLRELAEEENHALFREIFPQGMVRAALLKALKAEPDGKSEDQPTSQIEVGVPEQALSRAEENEQIKDQTAHTEGKQREQGICSVAGKRKELSNPLEVYARKWLNILHQYHVFANDYWTEPLETKEIARLQVAELTKAAADYEYGINHPYKRVLSTQQDIFLEAGNALAPLALLWCDERGVADYLAKWEDGELRAIAEGDSLWWELFCIVPVLRVVPALNCLWRVLDAAAMSWQEVDLFQFCGDPFVWTSLDSQFFSGNPEFCRMTTKLNLFLCAPDQVETLEVLDYLPQSGLCRWLRDRLNHSLSSTESLEVLISQAALVCGDSSAWFDLAISHAKAAIPHHLMPQKVMHAQAALGSAMTRREQTGARTKEVSQETLAVSEAALGSAKKMRLQKYVGLIKAAARV